MGLLELLRRWRDDAAEIVMPDDMFEPIFGMFVPLNGADEQLLTVTRALSVGEVNFSLDKSSHWVAATELDGVGSIGVALDGSVTTDFAHEWLLPPCAMGPRTVAAAVSNPSLAGAASSGVRLRVGPLAAGISADHENGTYMTEVAASFKRGRDPTLRLGAQVEHSAEDVGEVRVVGCWDDAERGLYMAALAALNTIDEPGVVRATAGARLELGENTHIAAAVKHIVPHSSNSNNNGGSGAASPFVALASVNHSFEEAFFPTAVCLGCTTEGRCGGSVAVQLGAVEVSLSMDKMLRERPHFGLVIAL